MVRTSVMVLLCVIFFKVTLLHADEAASQAAKKELGAALEKMAGNDLMLRGSVREKESDMKIEDGNQIIQVVVAGRVPRYEGTLEVWRNAEGETITMSQNRLPGFGVYDDGSRTFDHHI